MRRTHLLAGVLVTLLRIVEIVVGVSCSTDGTAFDLLISNTSDANTLVDALACSSAAHFIVEWRGRVELLRTLVVSNGSVLDITGTQDAAVFSSGTLQLIAVTGGAQLHVRNISLEDGYAASGHGGAISAEAANVIIQHCQFTGNWAGTSGGECHLFRRMMGLRGFHLQLSRLRCDRLQTTPHIPSTHPEHQESSMAGFS